jgi:hypothetical protein
VRVRSRRARFDPEFDSLQCEALRS